VDVLLDEEDADAGVGGDPDGDEEPVDDGGEARRELVEQQRRVAGECPGKCEHLLLAARQ
jgi:hypothetical protein